MTGYLGKPQHLADTAFWPLHAADSDADGRAFEGFLGYLNSVSSSLQRKRMAVVNGGGEGGLEGGLGLVAGSAGHAQAMVGILFDRSAA